MAHPRACFAVRGGYKRISSFESPPGPGGKSKPVRVLYCGGVHYDALRADRRDLVNLDRKRIMLRIMPLSPSLSVLIAVNLTNLTVNN